MITIGSPCIKFDIKYSASEINIGDLTSFI